MSNKLLSAIEDDVVLSEGSVPIVIEGLEHSYDTKDSLPDESISQRLFKASNPFLNLTAVTKSGTMIIPRFLL